MFRALKTIVLLLFLCGETASAEVQLTNQPPRCELMLSGPIFNEEVASLIMGIRENCETEQRLYIEMMSGGGSEQAAFTLYNFLRNWPGGVDTHAIGEVVSAAIPVFLAGEHRTIAWSALVLIHPASFGEISRADRRVLQEMASVMDLNDAIYLGIIIDRTGLSMLEVEHINEQSLAIGATEAVELNIAHAVVQ